MYFSFQIKEVIWCSFYKSLSLPQKDLFYLKEKADPDRAKTAHSNTPPHVYVMMWKYLRKAAQMFTQRKKAWFQ